MQALFEQVIILDIKLKYQNLWKSRSQNNQDDLDYKEPCNVLFHRDSPRHNLKRLNKSEGLKMSRSAYIRSMILKWKVQYQFTKEEQPPPK